MENLKYRKLSSRTYVADCGQLITNYLKRIGHNRAMVGACVEVWVAYRGKKPVRCGPSKEALETWNANREWKQ